MKPLVVSLIVLSLFAGSFGLVGAQTTPAPTCECWCGLEGRGAELKVGGRITNENDCRAECESVDKRFISCSFPGDKTSPHTNPRCWSVDECTAADAEGNPTGRPDSVTPAECLKGFTHCLPVDEPIKLSVALGSFTQVQGIGGYINAFYQWIMGAAAVFAVIMIMVGGVQYMMSGGSSTGVGEAKKRIFGALIGLVILFGAYIILNTVNPKLLSLQLPALPKIRPVTISAIGQKCESYMGAGYKVSDTDGKEFTNNSQTCGTKGTVTKGPDGETLSGDDSCFFHGCSTTGTLCRIDGETEKGFCDSCIQFPGAVRAAGVISGFESSNESPYRKRDPKPSESACGAVGTPAGIVGKCLYQPVTRTALGIGVTGGDQCVELQYDCSTGDNCEAYNNFVVRYGIVSNDDVNTLETRVKTAQEGLTQEQFKTLCEQDICGFDLEGGCNVTTIQSSASPGQGSCTAK